MTFIRLFTLSQWVLNNSIFCRFISKCILSLLVLACVADLASDSQFWIFLPGAFFFFCFFSSCIIITNAKIFSCKPINAFNIICIIICLEIAKIKCTLIFVIKKSSNSHRQKKIECSKSAYGFTFLSFSLSHLASYCRGDLASLFVFVYVIVLTCW